MQIEQEIILHIQIQDIVSKCSSKADRWLQLH